MPHLEELFICFLPLGVVLIIVLVLVILIRQSQNRNSRQLIELVRMLQQESERGKRQTREMAEKLADLAGGVARPTVQQAVAPAPGEPQIVPAAAAAEEVILEAK